MPPRPTNLSQSRREAATPVVDSTLAIKTVEQLKALAHPLRMQLLDQFAGEPKTAKQIAVALGLQPTRLYHHVAKLEAAGFIQLVKTRQVRGTTEKYYALVAANLKLDRNVFESESAKLLGDILSVRVIENLLARVQKEVADYLSQSNSVDQDGVASNEVHEEVMFAETQYEIADADVVVFRDKLTRLFEEFGDHTKTANKDADQRRKYRLVVGWYPRVAP